MVDVCYLFPFSICLLFKLWNIFPPHCYFSYLLLFLFGKFETFRSCSRNFFFFVSLFLFLSLSILLFCWCRCFFPRSLYLCIWYFHCLLCCLSFSSLSLFMFIHCLRIMAINWYAKWELIMSSVSISILFGFLSLIQSKPE